MQPAKIKVREHLKMNKPHFYCVCMCMYTFMIGCSFVKNLKSLELRIFEIRLYKIVGGPGWDLFVGDVWPYFSIE